MPTNQSTSRDSVARQYLYDVFLSHHSSDKPLVEMIAARLEDEAGLKPFLDKWHLVLGEPWEEELEEALDKSATCAVFLGPSGLGAWHNEEMRAALDERVGNKSFRVVPILLPGAEPKDKSTLPRFLRRLTWVDFRAGLGDQEAFHRLVAGIKGLPPGRQVSSLNSAPSPSQSLNRVAASGEGEPRQDALKEKIHAEMWKIVAGAVLALLLSTSFIGAAIPRYKLQVKSPAFKKEGVYEAPEGTVTVKWAMLKEQWFREVDVGAVKANVTIRRLGDENEEPFPNAMGEVNTKLRQGKYEVRIDAVEHQRFETIALEISASSVGSDDSSGYFTGSIEDKNGRAVGGAEVELTELLDQPVLKVTTIDDGGFDFRNIHAKLGDKARVIVRVKGIEKHNQYWTLPGPHKIKLEK